LATLKFTRSEQGIAFIFVVCMPAPCSRSQYVAGVQNSQQNGWFGVAGRRSQQPGEQKCTKETFTVFKLPGEKLLSHCQQRSI